ncbi:MAG: HAMP domain-containing sensor histidine kinase [candidate division WOR-3 bacterium]
MNRFKFGFGPRALQVYFVIGLLGFAGVWFFYSQFLLLRLSREYHSYATTLFQQLEAETQLRTRIYARFMSQITEPDEAGSPELDIIFDEVIQKIDFPVVITAPNGAPVAFRNISNPETGYSALLQEVERLDKEHEPIPVLVREGDSLRCLNVIHYGVSPATVTLRQITSQLTQSVRQLRLFSLMQALLFLGFVLIGVMGVLEYKRREQEHIWTALAKETAHQLATPVSSISAWLEVLRESGQGEIAQEMDEDLKRMREVLSRFSRIGLPPDLERAPLGAIVNRAVDFVRRRAPKGIKLVLEVIDDPLVLVDAVLLSWAIENLLKNSLDAIGEREGEVRVRQFLSPDRRWVEVEITDTGEGVKIERLFEPGVTTKPYGWGVGLTLSKRIVEGYHQGRLILKESAPGKTVFALYLPTAGS